MSRAKKNSPVSPVAPPPLPAPPAPPAATPPPVAPAPAGLFWERRIAAELGIARGRIRSLREQHLTAGEHFLRRRGTVVLTAAGLARIHALLAPAAGSPADAPRPATATETPLPPLPPGPPERAEFIVAMVPINSRLLVCRVSADRPPNQLVRVKDNTNFMPRMKVPVIASGHGWQVYGRLPRRKGRW